MSKRTILVTWGGIGDALILSPFFEALKNRDPRKKILVYCLNSKHPAVFENNPYIDEVRVLKIKKMWRYPYHLLVFVLKLKWVKYQSTEFDITPLSWIYSKQVKEIAAEMLGLEAIDKKNVILYFTPEEEENAKNRLANYKNVVFIHNFSMTTERHLWPIENWNQLVKKMPHVTFIQIGVKHDPEVKGALDWRQKTSLREAFCLLKYATSFVGVDSSMAHATSAFDLPGVVLFGDSTPVHYGHDNNINIYKNIPCSPCFFYLHPRTPCPYGHECMNLITVTEVVDALNKQLEKGNQRLSFNNCLANAN